MNPYTLSLALGATGLVVMALGGLGHHTGHAGHTPHAPGPTGALSGHGHHGAALPNSAHGHAHQSHTGQHGTSQGKLWAFLSPRVLCSCLGGDPDLERPVALCLRASADAGASGL